MTNQKIMKCMVRFINVDVLDDSSIYNALRKIKGINFNLANAICNVLNISKDKKIKDLATDELAKISNAIKDPIKAGIPSWLINRRKDYDTGNDKHLISADLRLQKEFDIKRLKKIKSYRGMRHQAGLPVRGQRTKAHFRKGTTLGVKRKK
ncbi:MAG: 30S ribosomal protein S13 [Nanoarchaeota archaeon]|nr:30S ribosomal protein S13 [Nanoarchaeota archaeon]